MGGLSNIILYNKHKSEQKAPSKILVDTCVFLGTVNQDSPFDKSI